MDSYEYRATAQEGAAAHERGDSHAAAAIFNRLSADASLSDLDRALMARNLAFVLSAAGSANSEVEAAYDRGIALEAPWYRGLVRESKAAWLAEIGRSDAAIALYDTLLAEIWPLADERDRWLKHRTTLFRAGEVRATH
jgi:hypothetical protein